MKKPNAFMQKQQMLQQAMLDVGMSTGFQKCWDLIQLCLRDPEVVGKDTFGKERISRLFKALTRYESEYGAAWLNDTDSDYLQEKLDANLKEIHGAEIYVFKDRYPYIKQYGYDKPHKNWR